MSEIELYPNQKLENDGFLHTKYLCVHDDVFGREKTKEELYDIIYKSVDRDKYTSVFYIRIKVISYNVEGKINVFELEIVTRFDKPIHLWVGEENDYNNLDNNIVDVLNLINYYEVIPCDYNGWYLR